MKKLLYALIIPFSISAKYYSSTQLSSMLDNLTHMNKARLEVFINDDHEALNGSKYFRTSQWILHHLKKLQENDIEIEDIHEESTTDEYIFSTKDRMADLFLDSDEDDYEELHTKQIMIQFEHALNEYPDWENYFMTIAETNNSTLEKLSKKYCASDESGKQKVALQLKKYISNYHTLLSSL